MGIKMNPTVHDPVAHVSFIHSQQQDADYPFDVICYFSTDHQQKLQELNKLWSTEGKEIGVKTATMMIHGSCRFQETGRKA